MFDAICIFDKDNPKTYSIFEFKLLPEAQIDKLRYSLLCPVCKQQAYFRRASKDGRQACFGSRYHTLNCSELTASASKSAEQKEVAEVEQLVKEADALVIDFSEKIVLNKIANKASAKEKLSDKSASTQQGIIKAPIVTAQEAKVSKHGLSKLLTSLLRGSSLATSDLWIYTSDTHKWRAKNLFVNIADAEPTEKGAPRLYWGTISHADKTLNWLNPVEERNVAVPIGKYREQLLSRFAIEERGDLEGAAFILFGKCFLSKDKKRKYIQLWNNDLQYFYLAKAE